MFSLFVRSSSFNDYELCPHRYYLTYNLGIRKPVGKSAEMGNIFHKAMELLGLRKLCEQNNVEKFQETDTGQWIVTTEVDDQFALDFSYTLYKNKGHFVFDDTDYKTIQKYIDGVKTYKNGLFWPGNKNLIAVEKFFDIPIEKPWAYYNYKIRDQEIKGYLRLRGTCDLLINVHSNCIEYLDWKTGSSKCWISGEEKDYEKLRKDIQLRLYFYALQQLFPNKHKLMTLFFTKKSHFGPRTVDFTEKDLPETEMMIREHFNKVIQTARPRLLGNGHHFKCKWCPFYKEEYENTGKSYCKFFADQIKQNGIDKTTEKHIIMEHINSYEGGGKIID